MVYEFQNVNHEIDTRFINSMFRAIKQVSVKRFKDEFAVWKKTAKF